MARRNLNDFVSFCLLTANIVIPLLYTISLVLEIYPFVMTAQGIVLGDNIRVSKDLP